MFFNDHFSNFARKRHWGKSPVAGGVWRGSNAKQTEGGRRAFNKLEKNHLIIILIDLTGRFTFQILEKKNWGKARQ